MRFRQCEGAWGGFCSNYYSVAFMNASFGRPGLGANVNVMGFDDKEDDCMVSELSPSHADVVDNDNFLVVEIEVRGLTTVV